MNNGNTSKRTLTQDRPSSKITDFDLAGGKKKENKKRRGLAPLSPGDRVSEPLAGSIPFLYSFTFSFSEELIYTSDGKKK